MAWLPVLWNTERTAQVRLMLGMHYMAARVAERGEIMRSTHWAVGVGALMLAGITAGCSHVHSHAAQSTPPAKPVKTISPVAHTTPEPKPTPLQTPQYQGGFGTYQARVGSAVATIHVEQSGIAQPGTDVYDVLNFMTSHHEKYSIVLIDIDNSHGTTQAELSDIDLVTPSGKTLDYEEASMAFDQVSPEDQDQSNPDAYNADIALENRLGAEQPVQPGAVLRGAVYLCTTVPHIAEPKLVVVNGTPVDKINDK